MARTRRHWPKPLSDARKKYDWDRWMDGQIWTLVKGEDFFVNPASFTNAARDYAKRHKIKFRSTIDGKTVVIQAVEKPR